MKKISSIIVVGAMLTCSGNIFNTHLFASDIKKEKDFEAHKDQGKRLEIIHKFMEEEHNSLAATPKIINKLKSFKLLPVLENQNLTNTIRKICDLHAARKLKKVLMTMDEDQPGEDTILAAHINKLDISYQLNGQERIIFKDLFENIKLEDIKRFT